MITRLDFSVLMERGYELLYFFFNLSFLLGSFVLLNCFLLFDKVNGLTTVFGKGLTLFFDKGVVTFLGIGLEIVFGKGLEAVFGKGLTAFFGRGLFLLTDLVNVCVEF